MFKFVLKRAILLFKMRILARIYFPIVFCLSFQCFAQNKAVLNKLILSNDTSYIALDAALKPYRGDSAELKSFINQSEKVGYKEGIAYATNQLAVLYRNLSKYDVAIKLHKEALEVANECANIDFKVACLNMLGVVYRRKDLVREALDLHKQAMELAESSHRTDDNALRNIAISHNSIGNIYLVLKQDDLAEIEFLQSMAIEEKIGNKLGLAINLQNLGGIYEERGEFNKALEYFRKSHEYNKQIESKVGEVICKNSIAEIYLKQGHSAKAYNLIQSTLKQAEDLGDMYYLTAAKTNMGWALLNLKKYSESELFLKDALKLAIKHSLPYYVAENYRLLAILNENNGNYKEALAYSKLHHDNEETYLNEKNQQYVADMIVKYDSDQKKNRIDLLEKENELVNLKLGDNRKLFSAAVISLTLLSILLYILYRQNKLKNEKELLSMEQTMLRSQMNPHFIFNSLNSIKLYIINNEKDKAVYYLNKFSKLIRTILTTSSESNITLHDELETMELYMNIENIRFSNKINFKLIVDPNINTKQIKIPSMVLQPFLENSIWHGLSSKTGEKNINLRVRKGGKDIIEIEIEDNGIGRDKSSEIKSKKTLNSKSIGISLTEQRLQNYFRNVEGEHRIQIIDVKDEMGQPSGTKIILHLPYRELDLQKKVA